MSTGLRSVVNKWYDKLHPVQKTKIMEAMRLQASITLWWILRHDKEKLARIGSTSGGYVFPEISEAPITPARARYEHDLALLDRPGHATVCEWWWNYYSPTGIGFRILTPGTSATAAGDDGVPHYEIDSVFLAYVWDTMHMIPQWFRELPAPPADCEPYATKGVK